MSACDFLMEDAVVRCDDVSHTSCILGGVCSMLFLVVCSKHWGQGSHEQSEREVAVSSTKKEIDSAVQLCGGQASWAEQAKIPSEGEMA